MEVRSASQRTNGASSNCGNEAEDRPLRRGVGAFGGAGGALGRARTCRVAQEGIWTRNELCIVDRGAVRGEERCYGGRERVSSTRARLCGQDVCGPKGA